jgi:predicted metal-dependent phosphoesterase TrpH
MSDAPDSAVDRHPHLGAPRRPGRVRVDMHSHTMWSGDCTTTPDELAQAVAETGLDVICITDHNTLKGARELAETLPNRVVVGEEVRTGQGELIGLFLEERIPQGLGAVEVAERIRDQGGVVYVPHPFDPMRAALRPDALDELVGLGLVDAIEVRNAKTSLEHLNEAAAEFASHHGLAAGGGSDAHVPEAIGAAYVEMSSFEGPSDFLAKLRDGDVIGHFADPPRQWRARVVPSAGSR